MDYRFGLALYCFVFGGCTANPAPRPAPAVTVDGVQEIRIGSEDLGLVLGSGFNSISGQVAASALSVAPESDIVVDERGGELNHSAMLITSAREYYEQLGGKASASIKGLGWGATARASWSKNKEFNAYASTLIVRTSATTRNERLQTYTLTAAARELLHTGGREAFYRKFGDCFVLGLKRGGELAGTISIKNSSTSQRRSSEAALKASLPFFGGSADFGRVATALQGREIANTSFHAYGLSSFSIPDSIEALKRRSEQFGEELHANPEHIGMVAMVIAPYSIIPEFGGILDVAHARGVFQALEERNQDLLFEMQSLEYMQAHIQEFPDLDLHIVEAHKKDVRRLLASCEDLLRRIIDNPFDRQQLEDAQVESYRPDWKLRRLETISTDVSEIGVWPNIDKDLDVHTKDDHTTKANINSLLRLEAVNGKVLMDLKYRVRELAGDETEFKGVRTLTVFSLADAVRKDSSLSDYKLLGMVTAPVAFSTEENITNENHGWNNANLQGRYWKALQFRVDSSRDDDTPYLGVKGTVEFTIELIER